jgi:hypothetical protein
MVRLRVNRCRCMCENAFCLPDRSPHCGFLCGSIAIHFCQRFYNLKLLNINFVKLGYRCFAFYAPNENYQAPLEGPRSIFCALAEIRLPFLTSSDIHIIRYSKDLQKPIRVISALSRRRITKSARLQAAGRKQANGNNEHKRDAALSCFVDYAGP